MEEPEILTAEDVAKRLKVSVPAVRAWTKAGLPFIPIGGRLVRFQYDVVLRWLAERRQQSKAA